MNQGGNWCQYLWSRGYTLNPEPLNCKQGHSPMWVPGTAVWTPKQYSPYHGDSQKMLEAPRYSGISVAILGPARRGGGIDAADDDQFEMLAATRR